MKITLLTCGTYKHSCFALAARLYAERLQRFCDFSEIEVKPVAPKSAHQVEACKREEAQNLLQKIPKEAVVIALDERGKELDNQKWIQKLGQWRDGGKPIYFVIGGAHGLDETIRQRADITLCLGQLTLTQDLARVTLSEAVYRAFCGIHGFPFGK
jgi:23S rRNA (pseudouridine1915-N3)-methyltransferase